jgi:peptidoglycan/LPS O-acetylase OafA/YrhL
MQRRAWFTLADGLALPQDNFLLLRMLAAAMVIYGHAYAIAVHGGPPEIFIAMGWGTYSGTIAVDLFFLVSGFLVTGSFLRRRNVLEFVWARALRVLPGYAACLCACAFVLGALYTTLPLATYFADHRTPLYVLRGLRLDMYMQWDLPGVFTDNPRRSTINGSIWTLPAEVRMYAWVALVGALGILPRRAYANVLLAGLFVLGLIAPEQLPLVPQADFVRLAGFFAFGAFCYINRDIVPTNAWLTIACALLAWLLHGTVLYPFALGLAESMFAFWFAYRLRGYAYNRFGDYSYGLYLWGFPAGQVIAHHLPSLIPIANAALALPLAAAIAVASWHLVEQPSLKLKDLPRRWWQRWRTPPLPTAS